MLRFEGWAEALDDAGRQLRVEATARTARIVPEAGTPGVRFEPAPGSGARFRAEVSVTAADRFREHGTLDLGGGAVLRFESVGEGHLGPVETTGRRRGGVLWRVVGGEGPLAEARGLITSNFQVGDDGALVDHQIGVLELP